MATSAQIAANRRNALHSTGPRTAEGKTRVRRNACKHGLRSKAVSPAELDPVEFNRISAALLEEYRPANPAEKDCVFEMAAAMWRTRQVDRLLYVTMTQERDLTFREFYAAIQRIYTLSRYNSAIHTSFLKSHQRLAILQSARSGIGFVRRRKLFAAGHAALVRMPLTPTGYRTQPNHHQNFI